MELTSSKKIDTNRYELEVKVGEEEFGAAVEQAFRKNSHKLTVPGFRKGKAPKSIVYKMYGEGVFYEDAVNDLYPKASADALDAAGIEPVAYPQIKVTSVGKEGFTFTAEVVVKPEVEVSDYKGISAPKTVKNVEETDVDEELERMRRRNSRTLSVTDRPAKEGDTVIIDFEGAVDGVPFEGGKSEKTPLKLGSGQFIPGFEEKVAGHSIGEDFSITLSFPEDYHEESLKGKEAVFKILIHEIKEEELPALDDEFAKDVSEFDTLGELRGDLKQKLQKRREEEADANYENALVDKVIAGMKADIPREMIENKMNDLLRDYEFRLRAQGITLEMFLQYTGQTADVFKESFRESADKQVRISLALEKIAELENIQPSDEDVEAEYKNLAERHKSDVERIKSVIPAADIRMDLAMHKAIDIIRENAAVSDAPEAPAEPAPKKRAPRRKKAAEPAETPENE